MPIRFHKASFFYNIYSIRPVNGVTQIAANFIFQDLEASEPPLPCQSRPLSRPLTVFTYSIIPNNNLIYVIGKIPVLSRF